MKLSKEEIRKRLDKQKKKPAKDKISDEQKSPKGKKEESFLFTDLKKLGLVTLTVLLILVTSVLIKEKGQLFNQLSDYLFVLFHLS